MAWFYILYSAELDRFYIGHTDQDVYDRLRKHMSDHKGWTARAKDWRIAYSEEHLDKSAAYRRELAVKGWKSRSRIEVLIKGSGATR